MSKEIKWIMFDADNTLLDFDNASKDALWVTFDDLNIACTDEIYQVYKKVNAKVWADFEDGLISAIELRALRFERLFEAIEIKPCSGIAFNHNYLGNLVRKSKPYEGVEDLLSNLKANYKLSIITNGLKEVQRARLERLNLTSCFDSIIVSDEIGWAKPHAAYFDVAFGSINHDMEKQNVLVVGDNLKSDIVGGLNYGMKTCWVSHGKNNKTDITPHHTIHYINEFEDMINLANES